MDAAALTANPAPDEGLVIALSGDWLIGRPAPEFKELETALAQLDKSAGVSFDASVLGQWDTLLITTLVAIMRAAEAHGIGVDTSGLPEGARRLLDLAFAVKAREGARRSPKKRSLFEQVGDHTLKLLGNGLQLLAFIRKLLISFSRLLRGKATYLRSDLLQYIQEAGAEAFMIVSVVGFLIGMIFAFVGVMQLRSFGAGIFTADLVGIAMFREMAPIMTAILMAGRTGAAYAAQIGTMKVNEEIDALATLGINPVDFLVMPRVIALVVMMPLLTIYAAVMGVLGGTLVGVSMLDISMIQYLSQTIDAVGLNSLLGGLFKSVVYGILVAVAGCQQGMACGNSAMAVGQSTTNAVVTGIVLIVVSASVLTVIFVNLGI